MSDQSNIEFLIRILGAEKVEHSLRNVKRGLEGSGEAAKEAERKSKGLGGVLNGIASSAKSFILGFVGLSALVGLARKFADHINRVADGMARISGERVAMNEALKALRQQLGLGESETQALVAGISKKSGASMPTSAESMRAADSLAPQGVSMETKKEIATTVSATLARYGGGEDQINPTMLFLQKAGAPGDVKKTQTLLSKAEIGIAETAFATLGDYLEATGRGGLPGILKNATAENTLVNQARAGAITQTTDQSAELMAQVSRFLDSDEARKIVTDQTGKNPLDLSFQENMNAIQAAFDARKGDPHAIDAMLRAVSPRERQRVLSYFTAPASIETGRRVREAMSKATAEDVVRKNAEDLKTSTAQANMGEAEKAERYAKMTPYRQEMGTVIEEGDALLGYERDSGNVGMVDDMLQMEDTQRRAARYAIALRRLGVEPNAVPGANGSEQSLRFQLANEMRKRGMPVETKSGLGGDYPDPLGAGVPGYGGAFFPKSGEATTVNQFYGDHYHMGGNDPTQLPPDARR